MGNFVTDGKGPVWWLPKDVMWNDNNIPNEQELEEMKSNLLRELNNYEI